MIQNAGFGKLVALREDMENLISKGKWCMYRLSFRLFRGKIPDRLLVCHKCDVRNCCNPKHLFLGTYKDNMDDMVKKKRHKYGDNHHSRIHPELVQRGDEHWSRRNPELRSKGENRWNHVLTSDDVIEMRKIWDNRHTSLERITKSGLGKMFKVSRVQASRVVERKHWKHLP